MALEDVVLPENAPKGEGVLFDDGRVGDHVDDAPHVVFQGVTLHEGQRGHGPAAARGHGQRVDTLLTQPCVRAVLQNLAAQEVQLYLPWAGKSPRCTASAGPRARAEDRIRRAQPSRRRLQRNRRQLAAPFIGRNAALRPLTKPATAKMPTEIMKSVGIFAYCVSFDCKLRSLTSV